MVRFRLAAAAAFLMFLRAADLCFAVAMLLLCWTILRNQSRELRLAGQYGRLRIALLPNPQSRLVRGSLATGSGKLYRIPPRFLRPGAYCRDGVASLTLREMP
jgi:hypothetical protein